LRKIDENQVYERFVQNLKEMKEKIETSLKGKQKSLDNFSTN